MRDGGMRGGVFENGSVTMGQKHGQHFLNDRQILDRIIDSAQLTSDDRVLEIGPGRGALTRLLVQRVAHVVAFEIDERLAAGLARRHNLELIVGDFLNMFPHSSVSGSGWKVVANLPYLVTSPILARLTESASQFTSLVLMMQLEVAERITSPATRHAGALTYFVQFYFETELLFGVPPEAFDPPPQVESAVVRLKPRPHPPSPRPERFFKLVRTAFAQRRKTLRKSLSGMVSAEAFETAGIDPQRRPETLTVEEMAKLEAALG
jgi:16S rRNA (adenine1518-N6/adenine1519-N6)-dimethyltransferase